MWQNVALAQGTINARNINGSHAHLFICQAYNSNLKKNWHKPCVNKTTIKKPQNYPFNMLTQHRKATVLSWWVIICNDHNFEDTPDFADIVSVSNKLISHFCWQYFYEVWESAWLMLWIVDHFACDIFRRGLNYLCTDTSYRKKSCSLVS